MKKLALSAAIASAVAASAVLTPAQAGPGALNFTTDDGFKFKFGISQELIPEFRDNLDFDDSRNTNIITGLGKSGDDTNNGALHFESRLAFTAEKDRVSMYTMIEWDGALDEVQIDHNNPNIERINLTLKLPEINGSFTIGADFFLVDSIGRMTYMDDDPGAFLRGASGNMSWQLGWTKRRENRRRGDSGGRGPVVGDGTDHDTLNAKFLFKGETGRGGKWALEPYAIYQNRGSRVGATGANVEQNAVYLGLGGSLTAGMFDVAGAFVYHGGEVIGLGPNSGMGDEVDISAFAAHVRAFLNLGQGSMLGGLRPFVTWDFASGDDDPNDGDLEAFVPITTPNDLRADNAAWLRKSVATTMPAIVGNGAAEFGFETSRIGNLNSPTIGGISEAGLGESPGYHRFGGGLQGKVNDKWGIAARVMYHRFEDTATISNTGDVTNFGPDTANTGSIDEEIGTSLDFNVSYWPQKQLRITPYVSYFIVGDGAEQLVQATGGDPEDAWMAGIQFQGRFF